MTRPKRYTVEVVDRAPDILETFQGQEELSLIEIVQRLCLNNSRVVRLPCTLTERGYVEKASDGYRLGIKLFELAGLCPYQSDRSGAALYALFACHVQ